MYQSGIHVVTCRQAEDGEAKRRFFVQICVPNTPSPPPSKKKKDFGTLAFVKEMVCLSRKLWLELCIPDRYCAESTGI